MNNQLITSETDSIKIFFRSLERMSSLMEDLFKERKPMLNGTSFYTDDEVAKKLKISRRTMQDYRNEGRVSYIKLGGKVLYRSADIEKALEDGYCKSFRQLP